MYKSSRRHRVIGRAEVVKSVRIQYSKMARGSRGRGKRRGGYKFAGSASRRAARAENDPGSGAEKSDSEETSSSETGDADASLDALSIADRPPRPSASSANIVCAG